MKKQDKQTLSVIEAGQILGLGKNAAYEAATRGDFPVLRIGKRILVPKVAFERFLAEAGRQKPQAA